MPLRVNRKLFDRVKAAIADSRRIDTRSWANTVSAPSSVLLSYIPSNTSCLKAKAAPAMKTTWRLPVKDAMAQNPIKFLGLIQRHAAKSRSFIPVTMTGMNISPGALITFMSLA